MVKIHEFQYEMDNVDQFQERTIEFDSWKGYVEDIQTTNTQHTFPKNVEIVDIRWHSQIVVIVFFNPNIGKTFMHEARLISIEGENGYEND